MAGTNRMTFGLPMIKCSSCNTDIEISQLADHVCAPAPKSSNEPPLPKLDRAASFGGAPTPDARSNSRRMPPPPRINAAAANQPFRPQDQHTTPKPPSDAAKAAGLLSPMGARPKMNRSATSPLLQAPPSPQLPMNLDCAFPPFPTANATPKRGKSLPRQTLEPSAGPAPLYAPLSPRLNAGENISKRMDTIAPGPFDGRAAARRPSTSEGRDVSPQQKSVSHKRTATQSSTKSNTAGPNQRASLASTTSRTSTFSGRSTTLPAHPKANISALPVPPLPPLELETEDQSEGIDAFLSRLQNESTLPTRPTQDNRSKTHPIHQGSQQGRVPPPRPRRPSETAAPPKALDNAGPDASVPQLPLPSPTHMYHNTRDAELHLGDALPLPFPTYVQPLPANSLHTPSDSGLSDDSISSSFRSAASSRSSPPASETSGQHSRDISKLSQQNYVTDEPIRRVETPESFMDPRTPPQPNRSQPPFGHGGNEVPPATAPAPFSAFNLPESPMDPAIQRGLFYQRFPTPPQGVPKLDSPPKPKVKSPEQKAEPRPDPQPQPRAERSRGKCGGCSEPIIGKSIKDSSGRLTGRYHKDCFVCRTCRSPFPSAEFYVFDNYPYCEQHYHELNGSLCRACNRGIEGQYLETDQRWKFHPRCFHCSTCRIILRDDYYEVGGRAYCERHAYVAQKGMNQLGPGGPNNRFLGSNNLQKRRTRLMMM